MRSLSSILFLLIFIVGCSSPEPPQTFEFTAGSVDLDQTLVSANVQMSDFTGGLCLEAGDELIPAQAERMTPTRVRVWWFSSQQAGETVEYTVRTDADCYDAEYSWARIGDESVQLQHNGTPLIQYEHPVFYLDDIERTKKPFHHVFDPVSGELITKGPGGLYSHHRGIFYGYNRVILYDEEFDMWHAEYGERTEHDSFVSEMEGPVFGGHIALIKWKDHNDRIILEEERDIRVFKHDENSFFIDFHTRMFAIAGPVRLDGDLQHAGVQFRAAQYVADNADETRFIRPESLSHVPADKELGEADRINLPWNAMNFKIDDNNYTVVYMTNPANPGRAEMSERLYGRFGEFFPHYHSEGAPLEIRYRFWVVEGETPTVDEIERMYQLYTQR